MAWLSANTAFSERCLFLQGFISAYRMNAAINGAASTSFQIWLEIA
jgi:hypothetical protein